MDNITNLVEDYKNKIGTVLGTSSWITIDQNMINDFASITMDNQFIHINPEKAVKETPFGSTIAHGFLILSYSWVDLGSSCIANNFLDAKRKLIKSSKSYLI